MPLLEPNEPTPNTATSTPRSPDLWLSLATIPVLMGVLGGRAILQTVQELGQLSEEIFRGDRLPLLTFPPSAIDHPDTSTSDVNNEITSGGNSTQP
ncbi:hypothetical protein ACN4EK_19315 [Pantanalinema rosaneae CENA516]|uniref:hypothetical protein n=1 Tax=Pantanalinema rosaneae TaxID=1620701 RepID=UPI003D6FEB89